MEPRFLIAGILAASLLGACASPQEKAAKAQERSFKAEAELKEQRLKLVSDYQKCVKEASPEKAESCDYLLKAIEAIR